ncbi:glycosyltransferase family 39 protein [Candidatus Woesearchaeota archaeon]|nr:glycosyltransferase family 39 protein [Candidatus Woesearchaeota archaeon]
MPEIKAIKEMFEKNTDRIFYCFLILVFLVNSIWIIADNSITVGNGTDGANSILAKKDKTAIEKTRFFLFKEIKPDNPPLLEISLIPFYEFFGTKTLNAYLINSVYLAILIFSTYKIGGILYGKKQGFLAALLIAAFPLIIYFSKTNYREFLLLSLSALSFYILLKTKKFSDTKYSFLLGIILGIASLSRYDAIIFSGFPAMVYSLYSLKKLRHKSRKKIQKVLLNLFIASMVSMLIAGIWYSRNISPALSNLQDRYQDKGEINKKTDILSSQNLFYHANIMLYPNLGLIFSMVFFFSLAHFFFRKTRFEEKLLFASLIASYLFLIIAPVSDITLFSPAYYIIPLLIVGAVFSISHPQTKNILIIVLVIQSVFLIASVAGIRTYIPVFDNKLRFYRTDQYSLRLRHMRLPSSEPDFPQQIFNFLLNESENSADNRILILSNPDEYYWMLNQLIYMNDLEDTTILHAFYNEPSSRFEYHDPIFNGDSINYSNWILNRNYDFIIVFLPVINKNHDMSLQYTLSLEVLSMPELAEGYNLVRTMDDTRVYPVFVEIYQKDYSMD